MIIQPTGLPNNPALPQRAAPPGEPDVPLPTDQAQLSGGQPPVKSEPRPEATPARETNAPPPTVLTEAPQGPGWRGELLELKGRMDYLYGLKTNQCSQWWHQTVKSLPAPAQTLVQELANSTLTEARMQDPEATIAHVAAPVGVGVNSLMLAALQTETDARQDPQADRSELLKQNLFVLTITGEMIGRLQPDQVQAAQAEAGIGAGQSTRFAEALAQKLNPDDLQACQQGAAQSPVFRLVLHPGLEEMANGLPEHFSHYQGAMRETKAYLGGLTELEVHQTRVAREVEQFFQAHPEALPT